MTHISVLPLEIIRYILILTVLRDLDLRTLEQFGMVRGREGGREGERGGERKERLGGMKRKDRVRFLF